MSTKLTKRALPVPRDPANRTTVEALVGAVNELGGVIGSAQQRAVRVCELVDAGILQLQPDGKLGRSTLVYDEGTIPIGDVIGLQAALDGRALTSTSFTAGTGLTGGGTLAANRTFALDLVYADARYPVLTGGKVNQSVLPALAITDTFPVASQAAMLALVAERGDVAIRSDINKTFILGAEPASTLANWKELLTPTDLVTSVAGRTGVVTLTKADVGLPLVDNTSDANKPVSTAQAAAIALKQDSLGFTPANSTISIIAGNGLSGGGTLAATRTVTMGTPGTLNAETSNGVTATSHTHDVSLQFLAVDDDRSGVIRTTPDTYRDQGLSVAFNTGANVGVPSTYCMTLHAGIWNVYNAAYKQQQLVFAGDGSAIYWKTATSDTTWGAAVKVHTDASTDIDAATLGGLSATTNGTPSTIAVRTSVGDIVTDRLFRSGFGDQSTIAGAMAYRVNNTTDNYIRFCSSTTAIKAWLGALSNDGGTMTGGLSFGATTVAATDLTRHLLLHTAGYGIGISSFHQNYHVGPTGNHSFYTNGVVNMRLDANGDVLLKNDNSATLTRQPRTFVQSGDPGAAAQDGDLWFW